LWADCHSDQATISTPPNALIRRSKKNGGKEESAKVIAHFLHQKPASLWQEVRAHNNNRKIEPAAA
jgi:hypothetical protein